MTSTAFPLQSNRPLRFAVLGNGAIAAELHRIIEAIGERARALECIGTVTRRPLAHSTGYQITLEDALAHADVIVEVASVGAVHEHGARIINAGKDLLVASVGAFADPASLDRLRAAGTGHVHLTSGAIGGLDLLEAAGRTGGLEHVLVRSRKFPTTLIQNWMNETERAELVSLSSAPPPAALTIFSGTPAEAIEQFPASLNVAVAVSLAVGDQTPVRVELVADPEAALTTHEITASGLAGEYSFIIKNTPLAARPASSGLTARALVADLLRLAQEFRR